MVAAISASKADCNPASIPSALDFSVAIAVALACSAALAVPASEATEPSNLVTSELVSEISVAKADSKESTDSTKSPETAPNLESIETISASVAATSSDKSPSNLEISALVAAISSDNKPSTLIKSELVLPISVFKLPITTAKALSLVKSTALIKETTSTNVSLSASAANRIASILEFSALMFPCKTLSAPSALDFSVAIALALDCSAALAVSASSEIKPN